MKKTAEIHTGAIIDNKDGFDIIECTQCGFKHVNPLPEHEVLERLYKEEYYSVEKPFSIKRQHEDEVWLNLQYSDRYDTFENQLVAEHRSLLDLGSGPGFFLKHGKERGWNVLGIEPSIQACQHARSLGVDVINDFFNPITASTLGQFDVIHASLVLEHIPNPIELLTLARTCLKPNGIMCITAPNDYNPFQQALVKSGEHLPWWVVPKHHLNYFTPKSLANLLNNIGMEVFLNETTFPMDMFLLMGDDYVGNDQLGRACHQKRMRFDLNLDKAGLNETKRAIYRALASLNIGREICIYARNIG
ncbi:methyltransferase domain-containing protein [Shewanella sp. AC34-MNA-CIBAN-0136]|uniref:class I SAM-dependent methyltransferase n=1 Tax=Shewanella sp. AC34-MNA-CIBAN-0136 TaxID=3140463 RepID=UPI00332A57EA